MEGILLQPVPGVRDLDRLVSLKTIDSTGGEDGVSYPAYKDVRDQEARADPRTFDGVAAFAIRQFNLRVDPAAEARVAEPVWGNLTSANYFDVLEVRPVLGRTFETQEDAVPRAGPVAVISHALWQRRFGGDPAVVGRRVWINNQVLSIVGVAPAGFHGTIGRLAMDVWIPFSMQPDLGGSPALLQDREVRWTEVFARLARGASLPTARDAARAAGARIGAEFAADKDVALTARTLDVGPVERMASLSAVLFGVSLLVLLIVCSNVANLLLQRGAAREHEFAVRLALGARPWRIVRQLMIESLLLALGAVALGGTVLAVAPHALDPLLPASPLPIMTGGPVDATVIAVLVGSGVATVFVFGLLPAIRSARGAVQASLAGGGGARGGSRRGGRLRGALVAAQFALSLAVLVTAGLFLRRLDELKQVDRGFREPQQVALASIEFELSGIHDMATRQVLAGRVVDRVEALPGVEAASVASFVPLGFLGYWSAPVNVPGYAPRAGESTTFLVNRVGRRYFETMGIPILRGRPIDASDVQGARAVAVVNQAFAQRFWGDGDAVDRRITIADAVVTIVGVAGNGKYEYLSPLDAASPPFVYLPVAQWAFYSVVVHARAARDPLTLMPSIVRAVAEVDPRLSIMSPATLESYSSVPFLPVLAGSAVLTALGAAALLLATIGLYAVTAYAVTQQRRDIGIRLALGATPARVASHFLGHAAGYAAMGALVGIALAMAIASGLATHLPGTVPHVRVAWAWPFVMATAALGSVAAVAALIPANRAARVNPVTALRDE